MKLPYLCRLLLSSVVFSLFCLIDVGAYVTTRKFHAFFRTKVSSLNPVYSGTAGSLLQSMVQRPYPTQLKMVNADIDIAIVGGGIGGMALALSLIDAGFQNINIYETASSIKEIGVGINIQPHAIRELTELGLGNELEKTGIPTAEILYFHRNGQFIYREARGISAGYKWPQYSIHRGQLLGILHRAVLARLGADRIHTGHHVIDCGPCDKGAWAKFELRYAQIQDQKNVFKKIEANMVVACDGVHSNVRQRITSEGAPTWTGISMLRGLTKMKPFLSGRSMTIIGPIENEMVIYPISKEAEVEGMSLVNWVALTRTDNERNILKEEWNIEVQDLDSAIKPFESFKYDFIDVPKMIRNAEKVYQYPMIDRPPLKTWVYGNITLLGDAAHPMIPIGANGATQTILDCRILALELFRQPSISAALAAYDTRRREAVNQVVRANREESETRFLEIIHDKCPGGFSSLDEIMTKEELVNISKTYKKVAGFDPELLNKRESYSISQNEKPSKSIRLNLKNV